MKKWVNLFCLLAIFIFILLHFKIDFIFNSNIIAGGDTPSHYGLAQYIVENDVFFGWMSGNFAGFPMFQMYPPNTFFLILLLSKILSLQVAFKIVMVLGTFLLPLSVFYCLKKLEFSFPTPILGAIFSLFFLFNEGNSMWGANIPSTLAGEFAYSLGFAMAVGFIGLMYKSVLNGKENKWLILFLVLLGLTHGYPFVFVIMMSSFFLLVSENFFCTIHYFGKVYLIAFLCMGFWLIPSLFNSSYTIPFNFVWRFDSFAEVLPPLFYPLVAIALVSHISLFLFRKIPLQTIYLLYGMIITLAVGYLFGSSFGLVDIRFLPFVQIMLILLAAIGVGEWLKNLRAVHLIPFAVAIFVFVNISWEIKYIDTWIAYNFTGFEEKPMWEKFKEVNTYLKGNVSDARVVYEHSPRNEGAGTVRAFEMLPLFSGRSTLEGLYMQSSINSPFAYYIQSEVSQVGSHPFMHHNAPANPEPLFRPEARQISASGI